MMRVCQWLHSYARRLPALFEFVRVDIQSTGQLAHTVTTVVTTA